MHPVHDRVLAYIAGGAGDDFDALAVQVFAHQFETIPAYRRVCEQRGRTPASVRSWRQIPPVPTLAFKEADLSCAPPRRIFLTTGTTAGTQRRGRHAMPDVRLYRAAAAAGLKRFLFPDVERIRIASLIPSADDLPESSLAQMVTWAVQEFGGPGSRFFASSDRLDFAAFAEAVRESERDGEPVCLMTTTGALIRFFDLASARGWSFRLPHSSRLMDTGGSKGAPRPLSRKGIQQAAWNTFAVPGYFFVNEYGMTELSSQYYDNVVHDRVHGRFTRRALVSPRWLRPLVIDPGTLQPREDGQPGLLCHIDLANAGTAVAVLTEDVGVIDGAGLRLLGRAAEAEARGCSMALADWRSAGEQSGGGSV